MLGAAVATATVNTPAYNDAYHNGHVGGLLGAVLFDPLGKFGKFCLVVLALSIVANNCPNIYSVALSLQIMAKQTQRVPRFVWVFVGTLVYVAIAIPGYGHFVTVIENFMLVIVSLYSSLCLQKIQFTNFFKGILAGNIRRHRSFRALYLQERVPRLRAGELRQTRQTPSRHCGALCLCLWGIRSGHGHGPSVVYWAYREDLWGQVWR